MVSVIIVAAGSGRRMGADRNKVFLELGGRPILYHSIRAYERIEEVEEIILVIKEDEMDMVSGIISDYGLSKIRALVPGGKERTDSVYNGIKALSGTSKGSSREGSLVLIHDGARPLVSEKIIRDVISAVSEGTAAAPGIMVKDTIKVVDKDGFITGSPDRRSLRAVQTPQGFLRREIEDLYDRANNEGLLFTDDTALYSHYGYRVVITEGSEENLKITTAQDLILAEDILKGRRI